MIELKNVEKSYSNGVSLRILDNINLEIKKGDFAAIVGPSGSGKSTLMHIMGALDRPTKGEVYIDNKNIAKMGDRELAEIRNKKIGFVFQSFNLMNKLTALENVSFPMELSGIPDEKKAKMLLEKVQLDHRMNHLPSKMSGGEKQRVAIARALANSPPIILADEPTGNLDSKTGHAIMDLLKDIHQNGTTLVVITHDKAIAEIAKKKIVMKDGKIVSGR
ncbi:MAG: ABC transporter ATP-binding protein [Candidatus Aenigmarchaeota archaeon]|nr:ABC transporter ATP-binding protein [Candidatus Aenigmarchaeota archaeon]